MPKTKLSASRSKSIFIFRRKAKIQMRNKYLIFNFLKLDRKKDWSINKYTDV